MVINYFGESCFRLQSGNLSLLIDPSNDRLKGDIILKTLTPAEFVFPKTGRESFEVSSPGEYEIRGIEILGLSAKEESTKFLKTVYRVKWDEIIFAFLGHLSFFPQDNILEEIEGAEVLFIFSPDIGFLEKKEGVRLVEKLKPNLVLLNFSKSVNEIQKNFSNKRIQLREKLVFKKKDLEKMKEEIFVLKRIS